MVEKSFFGKTKDGQAVSEYLIDNGVLRLYCLDYGCIIRKLIVKDKNSNCRDVVLGFDSVELYERYADTYMGAAIGRVANRIGKAEFTLDNVRYTLNKNDGENCLHGGFSAFNQRIFAAKLGENSITFSINSPDNDGGFPGNVQLSVTYTLTDNRLEISYDCISDKLTPISLTNHSYFNLSGENDILEHLLYIDADRITPTDKQLIPTGEIMQVCGTPFDFTKWQKVGLYVDYPHIHIKNAGGYDHNFIINGGGSFKRAASLFAYASGILMNVYTDSLGLQFYSGNFLSGETGKYGKIYNKRAALCLETQGFPDAVNHDNFPSIIQQANKRYGYNTTFEFCVCEDVESMK